MTSYVESEVGIGEGGRKGLTAVTTGVVFLISLVLAPLSAIIRTPATALSFIVVGLLMASSVVNIYY